MSISLFDHFAVDVNMAADTSNEPTPVKYKPAPPFLRPLTHATFEPYRVQAIDVAGSRAHGTPLVESGALASVRPPMPKYQPVLEPEIISRGKLSLEQLETVIAAGEQHSQKFKMKAMTLAGEVTDMYRGGFLIADGAGVGKGRQLAGIIRDNRNQGRKRAVWLSLDSKLITDARRDWADLGGSPADVVAWDKTAMKDTLHFTDGILFGTYALLRSKWYEKVERIEVDDKGTERKVIDNIVHWGRLDQLIAALGTDFDGVIAFDESHALINAAPKDTDEDQNVSSPSAQGQAALYLQGALPNARIVYVSATAASRLDALAYAERLQLWGEGGAFPDRLTFLSRVKAGGTSAQEVVSRDLKAQGRMCARTLSFEGVRYQRLVHELDDDQISQFNNHNRVCRQIEQGFNEELLRLGIGERMPGQLEISGLPGAEVGRRLGNWRGSRLYADRQILMSLKMPTLIPFIEQQLAEGKSVVLQMTHTNQAALDRALGEIEEDQSLDDIDLSHREKLAEFLEKNYPTGVYKQGYDEKKRKCVYPVTDPDGNQVQDPSAIARRDALIEDVRSLVYPLPGLDELYRHFGADKIAEVSGRKKQLVWETDADGNQHTTLRVRGSKENEKEIRAFLDDQKQILVFTEGAGGVGLSFHSDIRFKNQRPRVHVFFEMSWRAEGAVQGMGRTHRTGQICPPLYVFATTNVEGEKRFSSTPARKIAALGALSRGQREAADNGMFRAEDNLEGRYGREALSRLLGDVAANKVPGVTREDLYDQTGIDCKNHDLDEETKWFRKLTVAKFLNRLMTCDIDIDGGFQRRLMNAFVDRMEVAIDEAKAAGTFDAGIETFQPDHLRIVDRTVVHVTSAGAKTEIVELEAQYFPNRHSWETIVAKRDNYAKHFPKAPHFAIDKDGRVGLYVSVQHQDTREKPLMRIIGVTGERIIEADKAMRARALMDVEAEKAWKAAYDTVTMERASITAITGTLIPVWTQIDGHGAARIVRAQTDNGERLLMRFIDWGHRDAIYREFGLTPVKIAA